ncbi:hypothetical protein ACHAWC_008097, partial [Mediolabrus comicus]
MSSALHKSKVQFLGDDTDDDNDNISNNLRQSATEAIDIVRFVAYNGLGFFTENNNNDDDDDYNVDNSGDDDDVTAVSLNIDPSHHEKKETSITNDNNDSTNESGSIIPFELSVNHLKLIVDAPGKPPSPPLPPTASTTVPSEDFLPVVRPNEVIFRWRHKARVGSPTANAARVKAYRIVARRFIGGCKGNNCSSKGDASILWDSDKVMLIDDEHDEDLPASIRWPKKMALLDIGQIIEWRVTLWDMADQPSSSAWSKVAIGPQEESDWNGEWIAHPIDMDTFHHTAEGDRCEKWKTRRPLPLFRGILRLPQSILKNDEDPLVSAFLVMSGLGSFRASFDGVPLSTSGPIDPAFTDYSARVFYRGFDVTNFILNQNDDDSAKSHVVGVTLGSGWWDHRPITGMAKPELLANGPSCIIAQLYLTTQSGKIHIAMPTKGSSSSWQVSRGHIIESDLFTGEKINLATLAVMEGWDTASKWTIAKNKISSPGQNHWVLPVSYKTGKTYREWREELAVKASAMDESEMTKRTAEPEYLASPIGKLVPSEIPPILPMERIAPDEIHGLGSGRWLLDFGKAFSGMLHFDEGLPQPIIPHDSTYPRGHGFAAATELRAPFITVVYGESLELTTGDINRVLVAGMGLHDGGPRHMSEKEGAQDDTFCFPEDHDGVLTQKDVYYYYP